MKYLFSIVVLFSISAVALEPGATPNSEEKEKIMKTQDHASGALKIQKVPAKIEGLSEAEEHPQTSGKKVKKKKKIKTK